MMTVDSMSAYFIFPSPLLYLVLVIKYFNFKISQFCSGASWLRLRSLKAGLILVSISVPCLNRAGLCSPPPRYNDHAGRQQSSQAIALQSLQAPFKYRYFTSK